LHESGGSNRRPLKRPDRFVGHRCDALHIWQSVSCGMLRRPCAWACRWQHRGRPHVTMSWSSLLRERCGC